ncbi:MAG TPA: P1 family peptidase [Gemmatimonadaceae bacterium]|nr:P1 family peptidase [Gemmatimonadaceae bacterium]
MSADFSSLGVAVGHATDQGGATGLTVVRGVDEPFRAGAAILGRATGTREFDVLSPHHLVDRVDALLLTGGSAFGLGAASGIMQWMEERGRGFPVGEGVVPIVPAAVIFDLAPLGSRTSRPTAEMAYRACDVARPSDIEEGSVGAGTGATVGKGAGPSRAMKGGLGCAAISAGSLVVGALAVVNALGDVRDATGRIIAGARSTDGSFVDIAALLRSGGDVQSRFAAPRGPGNTTLAVVATTAAMTRVELCQLATAAGAALSRRITPVGTSFDGDVIFACAPLRGATAPALQVEAMAVQALEEAIERAVRTARGRDGVPGLADSAASGR